MAAAMNRWLRGKTLPGPMSRGDAIIGLDELLASPSPLPDESPEEVAQLRAAILADLAPATAYERILAANLVELECEQRRLRRWIATAIRAEVVKRALDALRRRPEMTRPKLARLEADFKAAAPERQAAALQRCREAGVDLAALVAKVRLDLDASIARLEEDLRETERRRRALFEDLDRLARRRRTSHIPEAEILPPPRRRRPPPPPPEADPMATQRQIRANRANAARSTGPRSAAGRARSAANATRHGLTAPPDPGAVAHLARDLLAGIAGAPMPEPHTPLDPAQPLHGLALRLAAEELRLARIRAHLAEVDARLDAAIAAGQLDGAPAGRGLAIIADILGITENPCAAARAAALGKLVVRGNPALLDPVVSGLRARQVALRYRRESEAARRRLLAEWDALTASSEAAANFRNEAKINQKENDATPTPPPPWLPSPALGVHFPETNCPTANGR